MWTLIKGMTFKTFGTFKREFDLENTYLFRYLQLKHSYDKEIKKGLGRVGGNEVTEVILDTHNQIPSRIVSKLYDGFQNSNGRNCLYVKYK